MNCKTNQRNRQLRKKLYISNSERLRREGSQEDRNEKRLVKIRQKDKNKLKEVI